MFFNNDDSSEKFGGAEGLETESSSESKSACSCSSMPISSTSYANGGSNGVNVSGSPGLHVQNIVK